MKFLFIFIISTLFFSCQNRVVENISFLESPQENDSFLIQISKDILLHLNNREYNKLNLYMSDSITLSPYTYINSELSMMAVSDFNRLLDNKEYKKYWGTTQGAGDSIELNIYDYLDKYINDNNYLNYDTIILNNVINRGNMQNNIQLKFDNSSIVEIYKKNTPISEFNWSTLCFVYKKSNHKWYLLAIVRNIWTI